MKVIPSVENNGYRCITYPKLLLPEFGKQFPNFKRFAGHTPIEKCHEQLSWDPSSGQVDDMIK